MPPFALSSVASAPVFPTDMPTAQPLFPVDDFFSVGKWSLSLPEGRYTSRSFFSGIEDEVSVSFACSVFPVSSVTFEFKSEFTISSCRFTFTS